MSRQPSLSANIAANYASQIYVTAIGIVMVPLYLRYMGAEAYGLVGFFVMLQAWFSLLDMGLTPTMARESARYRGGATTALEYRRLVRALQALFLLIAVTGGFALFASAGLIAREWLKPGTLPISEVSFALQVMAIGVALRWMSGLYRGVITGQEQMVWLANFTAIIATLRFVGVLPVLMFIDPTPSIFFTYQLVIAALELGGMALKAYSLLPPVPVNQQLGWPFAAIRPVLKFAVTIAVTAAIGMLITQTDKLVLSNILPLAEYGYFSLAVLVASGVVVISVPVSGAIMPRMTKLEAAGDQAGLITVYRASTQLVAVIASATSITLAFCAEPLLWAWTGDRTLATYAAPLLNLYAIGNGIFAVAAFPYYLQYAKGNLRLHVLGNIGFVMLIVPAMIFAARHYGSLGAATVWLVMNMISFIAWLPLVHARFAPGLNRKWYIHDVLAIYAASGAAGALLSRFLPHSDSRLWQLVAVAAFGAVLLGVGTIASGYARSYVRTVIENRLADKGARP